MENDNTKISKDIFITVVNNVKKEKYDKVLDLLNQPLIGHQDKSTH